MEAGIIVCAEKIFVKNPYEEAALSAEKEKQRRKRERDDMIIQVMWTLFLLAMGIVMVIALKWLMNNDSNRYF